MSARIRPVENGWLLACVLGAVLSAACQARAPERELVSEVAALTPRPRPPITAPPVTAPPVTAPLTREDPKAAQGLSPSRSPCPDVERQARELGAALPRQLDADTRALRVSARGCDLTLEYELVTLSAKDVVEPGMRAMRSQVTEQLCSDPGALGVMQRGGRFTNVYYDRVHDPIGLFTVAADDCGI